MPRYRIMNAGHTAVPLPSPLQGTVPPRTNITIETEAVNVDTKAMRALVKSGVIRVTSVVESPGVTNKIEIPVLDLTGAAAIDGRFDQPPVSAVFGHDVDGNLETVTYSDSKVKVLSYDSDGNLDTITFDGQTKTLVYDGDGVLVGYTIT